MANPNTDPPTIEYTIDGVRFKEWWVEIDADGNYVVTMNIFQPVPAERVTFNSTIDISLLKSLLKKQ